MQKLKVTLLTARTMGQGRAKYAGKFLAEFKKNVAVCELDPEDLAALKIGEGDCVRVTTEFGSVVLRAAKSRQAPHKGVVLVPYGPWANVMTDPTTHGTGMPSLKGIQAEVEAAPDERVLDLKELFGGQNEPCL